MSTGDELIQACRKGDRDDAQQLIESGVDVEWKEENVGWTPLMMAAANGRVEIIRLLLDHGANIHNKSDDNGSTALHCAAFHGQDGAVSLLIERGADFFVRNTFDCTPLDWAGVGDRESAATIIEAAINSAKVIYISSARDLQQHICYDTFLLFNNNVIILAEDGIPDGFELKGHPTFSLRHIQQCIDQNPPTDNKDNIPPDDVLDNILSQRHPNIAARLQYWRMNLLHLILYFPTIRSNNIHEVISSIVMKCPQASTVVDIDGMTPLHHAAINLSQKRTSQECHDLLLAKSPPIVIHRAIEVGLDWEYLYPIVMAKLNALTMEDEESGLVPFMLVAERCKEDNDDKLDSLSMAYELLCLKPDVLKEYDVSNMAKRTLDGNYTKMCSGRDTKRRCLEENAL